MSDEAGRARGRARGRASGEDEPGQGSPPASGSPPTGAAARGRGGTISDFAKARFMNTIPKKIDSTVGTIGVNIPLMANYIKFEAPPGSKIYDYRVDFEPVVEASVVRKGMIADHKSIFGGAYIFDGEANIKSTTKLELDSHVIHAVRKTDQVPITITIRYSGEIGWGSNEMLRLYNTQVRRNLQHLKYILIGRHYFDPTKKIDMPEFKLQIWPGLQTAVNVHDGGILMVCDTVHKVVRAETVYDILQQHVRRDRTGFKDNARRDLAGAVVMTAYNSKTYKIEDIAFDKNPNFEFERKGVKTTLIQYFKDQHNQEIRDPRQPLIRAAVSERDKRNPLFKEQGPIYLIPELCSMTGLSESARSDLNLRKAMTQATQAVPNIKIKNLIQFRANMVKNEHIKKEMQAWGLSFGPGVVNFSGRQLPGEKILMQGDSVDGGTAYDQKSGDFSKEIRGKPMRRGMNLNKWTMIVSSRDKLVVDDFGLILNRVSGPLKFNLQKPEIIVLDNDRTGTYIEACKKVRDVQMVVIIVPNNNKDRYDTIKKIFCIETPIASQVIVARTLQKQNMLMSICTKICIQMACKLGSEPWALSIPPKKLMVVGYDTHHDGTRKSESVGGFVCSINDPLTRYYSRVSYHKDRNEMTSNFRQNLVEGLKHYHKVNSSYPERLVVYRDGVSEGQIPHVFDVELKDVEEACDELAGKEAIKLAFIIVTKRVNSRFFLRTGERNAENPIPGTIIDHTVTRQGRYDFYLISQSVKQGTVGPTNYNIIEDKTTWKPHHHQQLCFKLTHFYFNWMGTIRVPAPCQYAHKLAYLTGTALHKEPNVMLSDTLFYL